MTAGRLTASIFGIDGDGAHRRPGKNDGDDPGVDHMRPPTQAVMAEHGSEQQLYVENENGEQREREQRRACACRDRCADAPRIQRRPVKTAIERQCRRKSARPRRGRWKSEPAGERITVRPPRTPCAITVPSAASPRMRSQRRFSARQVQTARIMVSRPTNSATMRWLCSYLMPPTMCGIL